VSDISTTALTGQKVTNLRGERVGRADRPLYQGDRSEADWLEIKLGWFGLRSKIVPLDHVTEAAGCLQLVEEREWVQCAPDVALDGDRMSDEAADRLRDHYGLERLTGLTVQDDDIELPRETRDAKPPAMDEKPGNPITERRRERARELGIPSSEESSR
jgi:hypothetical protein